MHLSKQAKPEHQGTHTEIDAEGNFFGQKGNYPPNLRKNGVYYKKKGAICHRIALLGVLIYRVTINENSKAKSGAGHCCNLNAVKTYCKKQIKTK